LIAIGLVFVLLFVARLGGARRTLVAKRWPAFVMGALALLLLLRGALWPAIAFAALAALAWMLEPRLLWPGPPPQPQTGSEDPRDAEARATLGVSLGAAPTEIRAAYRAKMRQAHPDLGGAHNEAARLAAARDRLLKRK
jgi:DnaJ-domain-containing protein 1